MQTTVALAPRAALAVPRFDVTTIGEGQLRLCVPAGERMERARTFDVFVSGTEGNVAATLARLGRRTAWSSALPDTPMGRRVASEFALAGVDLSGVHWLEGRLATYYVEYAVPPRSIQVWFDRANSSFTKLTPARLDWDHLLDAELMHLSGITLALPGPDELVREAVARARAAGVRLSFDVNYRARLWSPEQAREALLPVLQQVDVLFCSRADAKTLLGIDAEPAGSVLTELARHTAAKQLIMSDGPNGLYGWERGDDRPSHAPAREVTILDRIGAGDAMVAGVLHGILAGNLPRGLKYGALCAALALGTYGDQPLVDAAEVERLVDVSQPMIVR